MVNHREELLQLLHLHLAEIWELFVGSSAAISTDDGGESQQHELQGPSAAAPHHRDRQGFQAHSLVVMAFEPCRWSGFAAGS
eukprot:SAG31_NODE_98_length_25640_cov_9.936744_20_plen_82_part_00